MTALLEPTDYFTFPISWEATPKLKRKWTTNILAGLFGNEQRSKLVSYPSHTYTFTVNTSGYQQTMDLKRRLFKNLHQVWGIPIYIYPMKTVLPVSIGDSNVTVDFTIGRELLSFGRVFIGSSTLYEAHTIFGVSGPLITLDTVATYAWPVGTKVYTLMYGTLENVQELGKPTPYNFKAEFTFVESSIRLSEYGV